MTKERAINLTRNLFVENIKNSVLFEKVETSAIESALEEENVVQEFVDRIYNANPDDMDEVSDKEFIDAIRLDVVLLCHVIKNRLCYNLMIKAC